MVKLVKREGKLVLPSNRVDWDKSIAKKKITSKYGRNIRIVFSKLRRDGTRSVKIKLKGSNQWTSWSYLTDIR